jgi:hypothetical protein
MIDNNISGCNWCECPAGSYLIRPLARRVSTAQLEVSSSSRQAHARRRRPWLLVSAAAASHQCAAPHRQR